MSVARGIEVGAARGEAELRLVTRLLLVGAAAVLLQLCFFSGLRLLGTDLNVLPLVALATGFLAGPAGGAATGFGMGIAADLLLGVPLGISALSLLVIGDLGGRLGSARDPEGIVMPMISGALAIFGALVLEALVQMMLGAPSAASWELARAIVSSALLGGLLAPLVYRATRRGLIGALPADPRRRRRRATTTRLSPLSSSRGQTRQRSRAVARTQRAGTGTLSGGTGRRNRTGRGRGGRRR